MLKKNLFLQRFSYMLFILYFYMIRILNKHKANDLSFSSWASLYFNRDRTW
jgi:hypothetical protein